MICVHVVKQYVQKNGAEGCRNIRKPNVYKHVESKMVLYTKILYALANYKDLDYMMTDHKSGGETITIENPFSMVSTGASDWRKKHNIQLEDFECSSISDICYKGVIEQYYGVHKDISSLLLLLYVSITTSDIYSHGVEIHPTIYRERMKNLIEVVKCNKFIGWLLDLE